MGSDNDDLLGLLLREYTGQLDSDRRRSISYVAAFVEWGREYLRKHPVVGTHPVASGLGLRLQDGTSVPFVPQPPDRPMRDEAVHVTNPGFNPTTDLVVSESMPVTGKPRRP